MSDETLKLHVLSLPHTTTVRAFDHCAFSQKQRKFASMMHDHGYPVTLYAGEENEARCSEHVCCITKAEQDELLNEYDWYRRGEIYGLPYDENLPLWRLYHKRAIEAISERIEPHDIICLAASTNAPVMRAFPAHMSVETGVGYEGACAPYRVFESYAWMHTVYGHQQGAANADGRFYDAVIPNFFEVNDFPAGEGNGDYFLFMSRMTKRKGYEIAIDATRETQTKLVIAGVGGDRPEESHIEYAGLVHGEDKAKLLGDARAIFVPTLYVEPFGGVAVEAMLTGTPVICTDWGAFSENIENGIDGYRCRTMKEFKQAINNIDNLDRNLIRKRSIENFSTDAISKKYDEYFKRLHGLWRDGFYEK